ncbi:MAG: pyridoxamine 5'-phosphate oxidase [Saprospiraceae bacterium]|nr:pyridoxamine 5'-phosphate oxidase [Saprospiraceae bacterium]
MNYKNIRKDYQKHIFDTNEALEDPIDQFKIWFEEAIKAGIEDVNAMNLATVGPNGRPSSRMVLLKELTQTGIIFFTNYLSRKGQEIIKNPYCSVCFYWKDLERQVRMEGILEKLDRKDSVNYFDSRPLDSRISAIVSAQSEIIPNKKILEDKIEELNLSTDKVICPEHWGGLHLIIDRAEFWQGRPNRLHDRVAYQLNSKGMWDRVLLAP